MCWLTLQVLSTSTPSNVGDGVLIYSCVFIFFLLSICLSFWCNALHCISLEMTRVPFSEVLKCTHSPLDCCAPVFFPPVLLVFFPANYSFPSVYERRGKIGRNLNKTMAQGINSIFVSFRDLDMSTTFSLRFCQHFGLIRRIIPTSFLQALTWLEPSLQREREERLDRVLPPRRWWTCLRPRGPRRTSRAAPSPSRPRWGRMSDRLFAAWGK